jgi:hypothetical protein
MKNPIFLALIFAASLMSHSQASVGSATGCYKLSINIPTQLNRANSSLLPTGASICTSEKNMQDAGYDRALQTGEIQIVIRNLKRKVVAAYDLRRVLEGRRRRYGLHHVRKVGGGRLGFQ